MSQHDLTIDNQGFPAFRADLNNALQALGSTQSGTSAPSPTFANQLWYDTTNNQLKIRNEDNDAWITLLTLDQTADSVSQLATAIAVLSAGTAGAPALTTTGDTNTGIFFPAADTIAFAEGGAEVMRIDSSGRVGVGVTSPDGLLTLPATASSTPKIRLQSATSDVDATITSYADANGTYATFGSNGYLDSNGDEAVFDSAKRSAYVRVDGRSQGAVMFGTATSGIPSERMRITSSGLVGIGTASPNEKFDVNRSGTGNSTGGISITNENTDGYGGEYNFYHRTGTGADVAKRSAIRSEGAGTGNNYLQFLTTVSSTFAERVRISSAGFLKASNDGTYVGITGSYHEFRTNDNNPSLFVTATNASFSSNAKIIDVTRSATSGYNFGIFRSSAGGDSEFVFRGDGNGYADGTWNNNGADYAEFFESATGQSIPVGSTVVLENNKVRLATQSDNPADVIGVVRPKEPSKASMIVGNTAWNKWANKYLTDDFDRYIMEDHDVLEWEEQQLEKEAVDAVEAVIDEEGKEISPAIPAQEAIYKTIKHSYESHNIPSGITVPNDAVRKSYDEKGNKFQHYKLNPAWDKDAEYVNRENRDEWLIIGLVGQVKILKGQIVGDRWKKMRNVSANVEEWFIR